jgi:hypothetical protein
MGQNSITDGPNNNVVSLAEIFFLTYILPLLRKAYLQLVQSFKFKVHASLLKKMDLRGVDQV